MRAPKIFCKSRGCDCGTELPLRPRGACNCNCSFMFLLVRGSTNLYLPDGWKRQDRNDRGDWASLLKRPGCAVWSEETLWIPTKKGPHYALPSDLQAVINKVCSLFYHGKVKRDDTNEQWKIPGAKDHRIHLHKITVAPSTAHRLVRQAQMILCRAEGLRAGTAG